MQSIGAVEAGETSFSIRLLLQQVRFEARLHCMRTIPSDDQLESRDERLAQAAGPGDDLEERLRLAVSGARHGGDLSALHVDTILRFLDQGVQLSDLVLEVGDDRLLL